MAKRKSYKSKKYKPQTAEFASGFGGGAVAGVASGLFSGRKTLQKTMNEGARWGKSNKTLLKAFKGSRSAAGKFGAAMGLMGSFGKKAGLAAVGTGLAAWTANRIKAKMSSDLDPMWAFGDELNKIAAPLSPAARSALVAGEFVFPGERKYPIHDIGHARNALARVSQHGTAAEKSKVRSAVYAKYPQLKERKEAKEKTASAFIDWALSLEED